MWFFSFFSFESIYDCLKSKSPYCLLNKNINFYKNELKSEMENATQCCVLAYIRIRIKSKNMISLSSQKENNAFF